MKILIVDDDAELRVALKEDLEATAYAVDCAVDGKEGSYAARVNHYDLVIMDYSMPNKNGLVACKEIRSAGLSMPILFLSVNDGVATKVDALESGADDYLEKPFSYPELAARVKALLRRPAEIRQSRIAAGDIVLDVERQAVTVDGSPLYLTRKEYGLLEYLMKNKGAVLSRTMIMEHVWNAESDPFSNTVEAHVTNLRKKLHGNGRQLIRNIPGRGYVLDDMTAENLSTRA